MNPKFRLEARARTLEECDESGRSMGKLGEFGQAVIRKKADQMIAEFARNLSAQVTAPR